MSNEYLKDIFQSVKTGGMSLYIKDREDAFLWYEQQQGFPSIDLKNETNLLYLHHLSKMADEKSIWKESWAGFHHILMGYFINKNFKEIPVILFYLGRAHTGMGQYDLGYLYLESARTLNNKSNESDFYIRILLELAVLAILMEDSNFLNIAKSNLIENLFRTTQDISLAKKAAQTLFNEGLKNQEWRLEDKPVKECQIHARGYYEISLFINKELQDIFAIGIILINIGKIWKELGEYKKAQNSFIESLNYFKQIGDKQYNILVKEELSKLYN